MNESDDLHYLMPRVGDVVAGKYRLEKVAGEGGMGIVYAAEHLVLRQRVAVKVLLPDAGTSEAVVERFSREAQAAARILSEHVARVMDAGSLANGAPFLVMEYLEGCDLDELLKVQGALPVAEVADIMLQALEALAHAHAVGIVHRDLKPANLFLACRPDGGNVIKMLDFGISKAKARPGEKVLTGHAVLGSPVYMSPEQLRNAKDLDGRADLWSLGVVAYELLCGKLPFDGDGVGEIFAAILETQAQPVRERNPNVPAELSSVIARCLERKPDDRWADAAELARAVAPFGSGAFAPLVDRAEQVLARAKFLDVQSTPLETRQVVEAIEAAALRARQTGIASRGASNRPRATEAEQASRPRTTRAARLRWMGLAAASVFVVGTLAVVASVRATRAASAEPQAALVESRGELASDEPRAARRPPHDGSAHRVSGQPHEVVEQPATSAPPTAPRARASKPRRAPARPKFLNSRE